MDASSRNARIRLAALLWCDEQRARWGDHVPAAALETFPFESERIFLRGQQGIFKPRQLDDGPLSIRSALDSPYNDEVREGGAEIRYAYAPGSREAENVGLKQLAGTGIPLIYFVQVAPKSRGVEYLVVSPVFVAACDDLSRSFTILLESIQLPLEAGAESSALVAGRSIAQRYRLQEVRSRLHQAEFRKQVLAAYQHRCAVCTLGVRPLLDGAHILSDCEGGEPVIPNGLGLCALHHRAMDRHVLRVLPDYTVEINASIVSPTDETARIVLRAHHGQKIHLPRDKQLWPDSWRLERALEASA